MRCANSPHLSHCPIGWATLEVCLLAYTLRASISPPFEEIFLHLWKLLASDYIANRYRVNPIFNKKFVWLFTQGDLFIRAWWI